MRRLPAVQTAFMGVILDPRLASWAEICAIGRAFDVRHPTRCYAPPRATSSRRWLPSTSGPPRRWPPKSASAANFGAQTHGAQTSRWTSAGSRYWWAKSPADPPIRGESHHDAVTHVIYRDTLRADIEGRTEVWGLLLSLLPPANARCHRRTRDGLVPDALLLLRCPTDPDTVSKDHLHDMKIIHMAPSTYSDAMVKEMGVARSANARADKVNWQYLTKARTLDTEYPVCFSSEPDVEARPMLRRLRSYPKVRGQCVGAFAECSSDIHLLLREAARSAAMRYWRQVGAASVHLWRQLSRPTWLGTAAIGELN